MKEKSPKTEILIFTDEDHLYYPRPGLYKVLSGVLKPEEVYGFSGQWYQDEGIKINLHQKVLGIDTIRKELLLQNSSSVSYDTLLLTNGAHSFVPPIKGVDKQGVFTLRSLEDALAIKYAKKRRRQLLSEAVS
jgi:nitrite reductase (NADH) large subunit